MDGLISTAMIDPSKNNEILQSPLTLPCGAILKNRLVKSPMSDSLADGAGNPTEAQIRLYERWAEGGVALSLIGEVQVDPRYPEKPGNLVLNGQGDQALLRSLASRATADGGHLWPQLGHAGALSHLPISQPTGPSALDVKGLQCRAMSLDEIQALPDMYARSALEAQAVGFSGVQIHAGHGFLFSQFLSPLFNKRNDEYGGSIESRCRIILEVIDAVRTAVGRSFPIGIRINSTDMLEGGLTQEDALEAIRLLDRTSIDLIGISGGTYFPGAKASSDSSGGGPYFIDFARRAKRVTKVPLMVTGGFKKFSQAADAVGTGAADLVGIARGMVLNPQLANEWLIGDQDNPQFPRFDSTVPGGVTAWHTMRITAIGEDREDQFTLDLPTALRIYEERDARRCIKWRERFY